MPKRTESKRLPAKLRFGYYNTVSNVDHILNVEIVDESSGVIILEFDMTAVQLGMLLKGDLVKIDAEWGGFGYLGKTWEIRHVKIDRPKTPRSDLDGLKAEIRDLCSEHLVDGWSVFNDGITSHQRLTDEHHVVLGRYVDNPEEGKDGEPTPQRFSDFDPGEFSY